MLRGREGIGGWVRCRDVVVVLEDEVRGRGLESLASRATSTGGRSD